MPDESASTKRTLIVRLDDDDWRLLESLQTWLQGRADKRTRITQKRVIQEALDALEKRRSELERPR